MNALDRIFPAKVCINLERRPDRWRQMLDQFRLHGLTDVIRQEAADGRALSPPPAWRHGPGAYGCLVSHADAVRRAQNLGWPAILILEDDVIFHPDFRERFEEYAAQIPGDWDAIYLGGIHFDDPEPVSKCIARLRNTFSTYAYGLRHTAYDAFLRHIEQQPRPADHITRAMQRENRFYCFTPHLAWVAEDYSDIKNSNVNPWWLQDAVAMNGEAVRRVLAHSSVVLLAPEPAGAADNPELVNCVTSFYADMNLPVRVLPAWQMSIAAIRSLMRQGDEYVVVSHLDVYPYQWEFKASLLKCRGYDRVLPAHLPFALSPEDTRLVLRSQIHDVDTRRYERLHAGQEAMEFSILSRAALREDGRELATFVSPARLLRLHREGRVS